MLTVVVKVAREHNLVVQCDDEKTLFLPNGQVYLDDTLYSWHADDFVAENMALWQEKMKSFANVENK